MKQAVAQIDSTSFQNVRDFLNMEASEVNKNTFYDGIKVHLNEGSNHLRRWYGSSSLEEVKRICTQGWTEGVEIYERFKGALPEIEIVGEFHKKYKKKKKYSDEGDEIDVDKYICGDFDSMYVGHEKVIIDKEGKIVTIYSSFGANMQRTSEEAMWSGITSVVLTDILESVGYRVNLIGFRAGLGAAVYPSDPEKAQALINLKLPEQPLDLLNILVSTAYPGFFRYYGFKVICSVAYKVHGHLGRSMDIPFMYERNSFVIGGIWDRNSAYRTIMSVLREIQDRNKQ